MTGNSLDASIKYCCTFSKTCKFWSSKANWHFHFSLRSIILAELLGHRTWRVQKVMVCDWLFLIRFVCFCGSRLIACDCNYDWRQQKKKKTVVKVALVSFMKSAVNDKLNHYFWNSIYAKTHFNPLKEQSSNTVLNNHVLLTNIQSRRLDIGQALFLWGQYPAILTEQAWSIYYIEKKRTFTCGNNTGFPEPIRM